MLGKTSGTNIIKLLFYIVLLLLAMKFILILSVNFVLFVHSKPFKFQRFGHRTYWLIVVFLPFSFKGHTRQTKQASLLKQEFELLRFVATVVIFRVLFPFHQLMVLEFIIIIVIISITSIIITIIIIIIYFFFQGYLYRLR